MKLVEAIKEAERQADALRREAQQKARQMMQEAEKQAVQLLKEKITAARGQQQALLSEAEAGARQEASTWKDLHQKEIEKVRALARTRLPEAVEMIVKKVVKTYADR